MASKGDGSITRRKDGRYMVRVTNPVTHAPVTRYAKSASAAEQLRRRMVKEVRLGVGAGPEPGRSSRLTIADVVDELVADAIAVGAERTAEADAYRRRIVRDTFGAMPLESTAAELEKRLTRWALGQYRTGVERGRPYSPDTIGKMHRGLDEVYRHAVKAELMAPGAEPMRYVDRPAVGQRRRRLNPLSELDAVAILDHVATLGDDGRPDRLEVVAHLLLMGLRPQEVRAVQWSCVELDETGGGELVVAASMTTVAGRPTLGPPKTERSARRLAISANTANVLRAHHERQQAERTAGMWPADTVGFVVLSEVGTPLDRWQLARIVERWCRAAGVGHHSPYDFRSTAGSLASDGGLTDEQVSAMLGNRRQTARHHYIVNRAAIDLPNGLSTVFGE